MSGDDRELYESFAAVRREEEALAPRFSMPTLSAREVRRRVRGRLVAVAACVAAMIAVAVWLRAGSRVRHEATSLGPAQTASITAWKPATDFLLDTPGRELLQGVPAIGEWHGEVIARGSGERRRRVRVRKRGLD